MATPKVPPDGGWGFVVVVATSVCFFLSAGMTRCAGVLYKSLKHEFEVSAAMAGALTSIIISSAHLTCPVGAIVCKRLGPRVTMNLGGFITVVSLFISCWVQTLYQMYVVYAIAGIGSGLIIVSGLVVVSIYFKKYYKSANGVASAGVGIGLVAFPPLLQFLLDTYGWRGTMLITSAITGNICVGGALFRPLQRPLPAASRNEGERSERSVNEDTFAMQQLNVEENEDKRFTFEHSCINMRRGHDCACSTLLSRVSLLLGLHTFLNCRFTFFCWINLLATVPYICYIVFIIPRASDVGISDQAASLVLSALGAASICGRLASGFLINWKCSSVRVFAVALLCCGGGTLLTQLESYGSFVASSIIVGFFTGVTQATTVVVVRKYVGTDKLGIGMGLCYFVNGIGDLVGPIITGGIFDITASYPAAFYFLAGTFFIAFIQMMCLSFLDKLQSRCGTSDQKPTDV